MKQIFQQIGNFWNELGKPQRLTIAAAGVGVLLGIGSLLYWAQKPDMKLLYGKLGEKEASEVVADPRVVKAYLGDSYGTK